MRRYHWLLVVLAIAVYGLVVGPLTGDRTDQTPSKGQLSAWSMEAGR